MLPIESSQLRMQKRRWQERLKAMKESSNRSLDVRITEIGSYWYHRGILACFLEILISLFILTVEMICYFLLATLCSLLMELFSCVRACDEGVLVMYNGLTCASSMKMRINAPLGYWTNCIISVAITVFFTSFGWNSSRYAPIHTRTHTLVCWLFVVFSGFLHMIYICRNKFSSQNVWLVFMRCLNLSQFKLFDVEGWVFLRCFPCSIAWDNLLLSIVQREVSISGKQQRGILCRHGHGHGHCCCCWNHSCRHY